MIVNERQEDWNAQLPHVEFACNNSVSAATDLAPNKVHIVRLPGLSLSDFDRSGVAGHQSLARDHLAYCDLASERQQRANDIVHEMHYLTVSRVEQQSSTLSDALRSVPNFVVGKWAWLYNTTSTIHQGAKAVTGPKVSKATIALNWTGSYKTTGNIWYVFWTTRDRSSFRSLRVATPLRQDRFKVPGAFNSDGVDKLRAAFKVA